jgi:phosphoribosylformylglycinamidine cyclo-ligase
LAQKTFNRNVLGGIGGFGALYRLDSQRWKSPILVSSADGVGTKLKVAFELGMHHTVGADLVNHCVNDIAVHGAAPLFFLDYLATGKMHPKVVTEVVKGLAGACRKVGCALVGGETAEMPGFYPEDEYDLAGCIVGWVKRSRIIDGSGIRPGDAVLGLPSLGLHTNGYSLARKVLLEQERLPLTKPLPELGRSLGDVLLAPHRCYWPTVKPLLEHGWLKGLVHITGGGITDNTPRILPSSAQAEVQLGSWPVLPIYDLIAKRGNVPPDDMMRTFNMGLGMLLMVSPRELPKVTSFLKKHREKFWNIGRIIPGKPGVKYLPA